MPPVTPANDEAHQALLNQLDIASAYKPFRNPNWKPSQRRNKNVKQIVSETSRKEASVMATQVNSRASTPFGTSGATTDASADGTGKVSSLNQTTQNLSAMVLEKNARANFSGPVVTYTNIESAPSLSPAHQRHYCDITGLSGPYTDPKTRLRYHNKEIFGVIRSLAQGVPEVYLEARGAHTILK
ncbi:YL1 nuclear C-terminal [Penicillium taxi]|uniref:YL1 nuclear C-terminal n=1 Tax=Penicillium taxi TaxID=168475 RepID=UPI002545A089|nr:YL1 nuclear C-terminal [Penicillium taxi]KAJ5885465.1 YL1 nuclear C-terminal [Penicillium taxi]